MKLRTIVITTVIALSTQTVSAEECKTAQSIGGKGGGATGAFVGGTIGVAAAGGLTAACAAALAAAPVTLGVSLIAAAGSCGAAFLGIGAGATVGGIVGSKNGEQVANVICNPDKKPSSSAK